MVTNQAGEGVISEKFRKKNRDLQAAVEMKQILTGVNKRVKRIRSINNSPIKAFSRKNSRVLGITK
jgi:hypothetical protein